MTPLAFAGTRPGADWLFFGALPGVSAALRRPAIRCEPCGFISDASPDQFVARHPISNPQGSQPVAVGRPTGRPTHGKPPKNHCIPPGMPAFNVRQNSVAGSLI